MSSTTYQSFQQWNTLRRKVTPPEEFLTDDFLCWVRYECLKDFPFPFCPPETHYRKALQVLDKVERDKIKGEKTEERETRLQAVETVRKEIGFRVNIMGYKI